MRHDDDGKIARALERCLILRPLTPALRDELLAEMRALRVERGEAIFFQGEPAEAFYLVVEGWVKLFRTASNGAEAVVGTFTTGQSFAVPVPLTGQTYPASAEAVTDCRLLQVPASSFRRMLRENPELAISVVADVFAHLQDLVAQVETLKARTGPERVAELLLQLVPEDASAALVSLPYDKSLIAARLGMTPESLSRAFARLRAFGVTVERNSARVSDVRRLRALVDDSALPAGRAAR